jgi:hypothetical protein
MMNIALAAAMTMITTIMITTMNMMNTADAAVMTTITDITIITQMKCSQAGV